MENSNSKYEKRWMNFACANCKWRDQIWSLIFIYKLSNWWTSTEDMYVWNTWYVYLWAIYKIQTYVFNNNNVKMTEKNIWCIYKRIKNWIANICEIKVTALQTHTSIDYTYHILHKSPEVFSMSGLFETAKYKPLVNVWKEENKIKSNKSHSKSNSKREKRNPEKPLIYMCYICLLFTVFCPSTSPGRLPFFFIIFAIQKCRIIEEIRN